MSNSQASNDFLHNCVYFFYVSDNYFLLLFFSLYQHIYCVIVLVKSILDLSEIYDDFDTKFKNDLSFFYLYLEVNIDYRSHICFDVKVFLIINFCNHTFYD